MARSVFGVVVVLCVLALMVGCACQPKAVTEEEGIPEERVAAEETGREAPEEERERRVAEDDLEATRRRMAAGAALKDINFDFDDFSIREDAKEILVKNSSWMMSNPAVKMVIEGHCDERGTSEYNLALGERRATSAKSYLIRLGVKAEQLSTISYGEEKPLDTRSNEEAWAGNRRAHFRPE
jgi:peptidoglycan-associated lipoprotein